MKHFARRATFLALLVAAGSRDAVAQGILCVPVRPGDTAAHLARRLTGEARNIGQPWFQILNPATGQFVSKSRYALILAGWQACLLDEPVASTPSGATVVQSLPAVFARALDWLARPGANAVLWGLLATIIAFLSHSSDQYLRKRATVRAAMKRFADRFVHEFEQPLIEPDAADRAIQSRFRFSPDRARLEVLLAPAGGRRYPNLADHRRNVEYDVTRVLRSLETESFVSGLPYAQGRWVVVPFQLTDRQDHKAGGR